MKEDEIGGAYSTNGRDEKCNNILVGKPVREHSEDLGVDGRC
jgi:hypothetical protein